MTVKVWLVTVLAILLGAPAQADVSQSWQGYLIDRSFEIPEPSAAESDSQGGTHE